MKAAHTAQKNDGKKITTKDSKRKSSITAPSTPITLQIFRTTLFFLSFFFFWIHHHLLVRLYAATLRSSSIDDWACIRSFTCASTRKHTFNFGTHLNILLFSHYSRFTSSSSLTMCFYCLLLVFCLCISQTATYQLKAQARIKRIARTTPTTAANNKKEKICGIEPKEIVCFRLLRVIGSWRVLAQLTEVIKTSVSTTPVSFVCCAVWVCVCVPNSIDGSK